MTMPLIILLLFASLYLYWLFEKKRKDKIRRHKEKRLTDYERLLGTLRKDEPVQPTNKTNDEA